MLSILRTISLNPQELGIFGQKNSRLYEMRIQVLSHFEQFWKRGLPRERNCRLWTHAGNGKRAEQKSCSTEALP